jgi:hypothetical protein
LLTFDFARKPDGVFYPTARLHHELYAVRFAAGDLKIRKENDIQVFH